MNSPFHSQRNTGRVRRTATLLLLLSGAGVIGAAANGVTAAATTRTTTPPSHSGSSRASTSRHATARAGDSPTAAPAVNPIRLEDSPGWYPAYDPESSSVVIGRRTNAPLVSAAFKGGARSLDEMGRTLCRLLHRKNADSLLSMCVADSEFRDVLWREFPQSRPATGLTWEDGWTPLLQRLISGCAAAVEDYGGHWYEFQQITADSIAHYKNFTLYQRVTLVAKDDTGQIQRMSWLRAIAERKGHFKIYSTRD